MAKNSKIEWTDHTFNPWIGCTRVSPACAHCYAAHMMDDRYGKARWGAGEDRVRTSAANWAQPVRWNRHAAASGRPTSVFCASLGDVFDNEVDPSWRWDLFELIAATPALTWLLLTKRIGNVARMTDPHAGCRVLPDNVALGATMADDAEWQRDMPKLLAVKKHRAPRFVFASVEPMLGRIETAGLQPAWVICGGESGPGARPVRPDWVRSLRDQCVEAAVPFFFKQWGEWGRDPDGEMRRVGKKSAGAMLDGREWREVPRMLEPVAA